MRYFFHVEDGTCIRDPKGEEFPDDASAMREASKVAQELSKLRLHPYDWRVVVKNAEGIRVGSVPLTPREDAAGDPVPPPPVH
jgi:histidinol phosphatase-like enzyme